MLNDGDDIGRVLLKGMGNGLELVETLGTCLQTGKSFHNISRMIFFLLCNPKDNNVSCGLFAAIDCRELCHRRIDFEKSRFHEIIHISCRYYCRY